MWRFSPTDYTQLATIWTGPHPEDGQELVVRDEMPRAFPPGAARRAPIVIAWRN